MAAVDSGVAAAQTFADRRERAVLGAYRQQLAELAERCGESAADAGRLTTFDLFELETVLESVMNGARNDERLPSGAFKELHAHASQVAALIRTVDPVPLAGVHRHDDDPETDAILDDIDEADSDQGDLDETVDDSALVGELAAGSPQDLRAALFGQAAVLQEQKSDEQQQEELMEDLVMLAGNLKQQTQHIHSRLRQGNEVLEETVAQADRNVLSLNDVQMKLAEQMQRMGGCHVWVLTALALIIVIVMVIFIKLT